MLSSGILIKKFFQRYLHVIIVLDLSRGEGFLLFLYEIMYDNLKIMANIPPTSICFYKMNSYTERIFIKQLLYFFFFIVNIRVMLQSHQLQAAPVSLVNSGTTVLRMWNADVGRILVSRIVLRSRVCCVCLMNEGLWISGWNLRWTKFLIFAFIPFIPTFPTLELNYLLNFWTLTS